MVRFHWFKPNNPIDVLYQFDETIDTFALDEKFSSMLPAQVVVGDEVEMTDGTHWDLYSDS